MKNNAILVYYPQGAGGKFLISCLSLADNVAFPDVIVAHRQLQIGVSQEQKFDILSNAIDKVDRDWNDFLICPADFAYGIGKHQYHYNFLVLHFLERNMFLNLDIKKIFKPDEIVDHLIENNMYFLVPIHSIFHLYFFLQYWKNSQLINFKNAIPFAEYYRKKYIQTDVGKHSNYNWFRYLSDVRKKYEKMSGADWPNFETVLNGKIDASVLLETQKNYPELYYELIQMQKMLDFYKNLQKSNSVIDWNTNIFFNKSQTVEHIENLYNKLNLTNYNESLISSLYDRWIFGLEKVKANNKNIDVIDETQKCVGKNDFRNASKYLSQLLNSK